MATMERELMETFEAARKAADAAAAEDGGSSPEAGRCLDALRRLRGFPVTTDVLVSTQVRSEFHGWGGICLFVARSLFLCVASGGCVRRRLPSGRFLGAMRLIAFKLD
jgi:hypothetical protein